MTIEVKIICFFSKIIFIALFRCDVYVSILISQEETCPLCFGHDLCEDVSAGFLTLATDTPQVVNGAAIYNAHLGDMQKLSVKVRIIMVQCEYLDFSLYW